MGSATGKYFFIIFTTEINFVKQLQRTTNGRVTNHLAPTNFD